MPKAPLAFSDVNSKKKPNKRTCWIPTNFELSDEFDEVDGEYDQMKQLVAVSADKQGTLAAKLAEVKVRRDEIRDELRKPENSIRFVFQSVGAKTYDSIMTDSQPTDARRQEIIKEGTPSSEISYDPEEFNPAIIAASCVEPSGLTKELVISELIESDDWTTAELQVLLETALLVNLRKRNPDLGKG